MLGLASQSTYRKGCLKLCTSCAHAAGRRHLCVDQSASRREHRANCLCKTDNIFDQRPSGASKMQAACDPSSLGLETLACSTEVAGVAGVLLRSLALMQDAQLRSQPGRRNRKLRGQRDDARNVTIHPNFWGIP